MEKGLISVVVAVFNVEKYLRRGIASLQKQSYSNLQILLIDDCSCDSSLKICNSLAEADHRIEVYQMQTNQGIAAVRNYGIKQSRGEYICFFDTDDCVESDFISSLYDSIVENSTKISVCNVYRQDDNGIEYTDNSIRATLISSEELFKHTMKHCSFGVWNKLWHHSLFDDFFFNERIRSGSDLDTYKLVFKVKTVSYVCDPKYHYLYNPTSVSRLTSLETRMGRLEIIDNMIVDIKNQKPHLVHYAYFLSSRTRRNFILTLLTSQKRNWKFINQEIGKTKKVFYECRYLFSLAERLSFSVLFNFPLLFPYFIKTIHKLRLDHD